jgi:hypothetical protein
VFDVVRSSTEILYFCEGSGERYFLPIETASSSLSLNSMAEESDRLEDPDIDGRIILR